MDAAPGVRAWTVRGFPRQLLRRDPGVEKPLRQPLGVEEVGRAEPLGHAPVAPPLARDREGEPARLVRFGRVGLTRRPEGAARLEQADARRAMPQVARDRVQKAGQQRGAQVPPGGIERDSGR